MSGLRGAPALSSLEPPGGRHLVWQQRDGFPVAWTDQREVSPVQRGELGLIQAFHDGHDRSIHETDVGVRVPIAQVSDPPVADGGRILLRLGFPSLARRWDTRYDPLGCAPKGPLDTKSQPSSMEVVTFQVATTGYHLHPDRGHQ